MTLWYWGGGLSDKVVADAKTHLHRRVDLKSVTDRRRLQAEADHHLQRRYGHPRHHRPQGRGHRLLLPQAEPVRGPEDARRGLVLGDYLDWKVKQATTLDGKLIGLPIDVGPTALFYREDVFAKAGLPSDPAKVAEQLKTWDDFFAAGAS